MSESPAGTESTRGRPSQLEICQDTDYPLISESLVNLYEEGGKGLPMGYVRSLMTGYQCGVAGGAPDRIADRTFPIIY